MKTFRMPDADKRASRAKSIIGWFGPGEVDDALNSPDRLPYFPEAIRDALKKIAAGEIRDDVFICLRADDERWLVRVGPKGAWKRLWNFGAGKEI
jgi:hypothetical protein